MSVTPNSIARTSTEFLIPKKWNQRDTSPERNIIWIEPNKALKSVAVIYYLSRNGQLEHPHFIEVPLSSSDGIYLRDVTNRLNFLRGKGMAYLFSWSSKRSYKNGYVWHDLSESDLIHPTNGHDYVLKGSELLETSMSSRFCEISLPESQKSPSDSDENRDSSSSTTTRRRNQSWSSFENPRKEYRLVYKCESSREIAGKLMSAVAADAATQTEEKRRKGGIVREQENKCVVLSREELSPPPSMSSSDGVDGCSGSKGVNVGDQTAENEFSSGRMSASRVMMQLITCGSSTSFNCSIVTGKNRTKY